MGSKSGKHSKGEYDAKTKKTAEENKKEQGHITGGSSKSSKHSSSLSMMDSNKSGNAKSSKVTKSSKGGRLRDYLPSAIVV